MQVQEIVSAKETISCISASNASNKRHLAENLYNNA